MSDSQLKGFDDLSKKLSSLGKNTGGKFLRSSLMSSSLDVVKDARANVPKGRFGHKTHKGRYVAPGFASRNIARRSSISKDKRTAFVSVGVKSEAYYAVQFLELGTKHIAKQPWLTKSLKRKRSSVITKLSTLLRRKIEKEAAK